MLKKHSSKEKGFLEPKQTIAQKIGKKVRKRSINSKVKGNRVELQAAKVFSSWTGAEFHRVPCSGGLHWKKDNRVKGDLIAPPDFEFPFVIEVKARKTLAVKNLGKRSIFYNFMSQAYSDAVSVEKEPIVLARCNGMKEGTFYVVVMDSVYRKVLKKIKPILFNDKASIKDVNKNSYICASIGIFTSDDFFSLPLDYFL